MTYLGKVKKFDYKFTGRNGRRRYINKRFLPPKQSITIGFQTNKMKKNNAVFTTNCPHSWKSPMIIKELVSSDHMAVVVNPQFLAKQPERRCACFGDVREHRKMEMKKNMSGYDWSSIIASAQDVVVLLHVNSVIQFCL